jgi:hypothetical protein
MPVLSVVMSVYNGERFLLEAVGSILNQTFTDFEFIIIDDGSTDRTAEILSGYAQRDPRVRVQAQANKGRTPSLNIGIGLARGRYIARMDADDVALADRFAAQVEFLEAHPEVGLLGAAVQFIGPDRRRIGTFQPPIEDSEIRDALRTFNPFYHPVVMMRKDVVIAVGGYRPAFRETEDYDLFLRIAERSEVANLSSLVLLYRIHPNQTSVQNTTHQTACFLAARASASLRASGLADPLWQVGDVTPDLLKELGISAEELRQGVLSNYNQWLEVFAEVDADAAMSIKDQMLGLCSPEARSSLAARILVKAASTHYRRGHFAKALAAIGRAVIAQPAETGHHLGMALTRRIKRA